MKGPKKYWVYKGQFAGYRGWIEKRHESGLVKVQFGVRGPEWVPEWFLTTDERKVRQKDRERALDEIRRMKKRGKRRVSYRPAPILPVGRITVYSGGLPGTGRR